LPSRVFFHFGARKRIRPSGGLRMIFAFLALCREIGREAYIVMPPDAALLFASPAEAGWHADPSAVAAGDVVIFPETDLRPIADYPAGIRPWVLCQNHHYMFNQMAPGLSWEELGVEGVICTSRAIFAAVLQFFPTVPAFHVPCFIDPALFAPAPKLRQIAVMPRKMIWAARFIRHGLARAHPRHAAVPWVEIDDVGLEVAAAMLGRSEVFLALGHQEGLGLPPLEAMSAGCIVVGFAGGGGREFARPNNGFWCSEDDVETAIHALARALDTIADRPRLAAELVAQGSDTAKRYSRERTRRALTRTLARMS
jgi:glycosyltransferase involved in cell wall biosynthesis